MARPQQIIVLATFIVIFSFISALFFQGPVQDSARLLPAQVYETLKHPLLGSETTVLSDGPFPRKIWQSWKKNAAGLDENDAWAVNSWLEVNPSHRYELLTDGAALAYVQEHFSNHPKIVDTYLNLTDVILRSDLLRYIILYADGGIWSDLDTRALKPVESWIPVEFAGKVKTVVGMEVDIEEDSKDEGIRLAFCQWTIMSQPGQAVMWNVISSAVDRLNAIARNQSTTIANMTLSYADVIKTTGPAAFTDAVLMELAVQSGGIFEKRTVHNLTEPTLIGNILVLPVWGFACGQAHSNAGHCSADVALVQHLWKGSWKTKHPMGDNPFSDT